MIALLVGTLAAIGCGDSGSSNGGNGNGNGNGNGTMCEFTAQQVCSECDAQDRVAACETRFGTCLADPPTAVNPCEQCSVLALEQCGAL
jgi:hypothetical protein